MSFPCLYIICVLYFLKIKQTGHSWTVLPGIWLWCQAALLMGKQVQECRISEEATTLSGLLPWSWPPELATCLNWQWNHFFLIISLLVSTPLLYQFSNDCRNELICCVFKSVASPQLHGDCTHINKKLPEVYTCKSLRVFALLHCVLQTFQERENEKMHWQTPGPFSNHPVTLLPWHPR